MQATRRRTNFGTAGLLYCLTVVVVALASVNRPNNLLVWIFSAMLIALLVSGVVSGMMLLRLRAHRIEPRRARVGEVLVVRYEIRNLSRFVPAFDLHIEERKLPPSIVNAGEAWMLHCGPGDTVHAEGVFRASKRGLFRFPTFEVWSSFPFGLLRKRLIFERASEVLVEPEIIPLQPSLLSRLARGGLMGGVRASVEVGGGEDFFGVREYRAGDSIRSIAWKRLAGTDQLATIERSRAVPPRVRIVLDLRRATSDLRVAEGVDPRALEEDAITLAASLMALADRQGDEFGLTILGLDVAAIPLRRGHFHRAKVLAALAALDLDQPRDASATLRESAERATVLFVHPDRADTSISPAVGWNFTAAQLSSLRSPPALGGET